MGLVRLRVRLPGPSPGMIFFTASFTFSFLVGAGFFCSPLAFSTEPEGAELLESLEGSGSTFCFLASGSSDFSGSGLSLSSEAGAGAGTGTGTETGAGAG